MRAVLIYKFFETLKFSLIAYYSSLPIFFDDDFTKARFKIQKGSLERLAFLFFEKKVEEKLNLL